MIMLCTKCHKEKLETEFSLRANRLKGRTSWCLNCRNISARKWKAKQVATNLDEYRKKQKNDNLKKCYGIGLQEYEDMFMAQRGVCAICGALPIYGHGKHLYVDHCHTTKKIRALLCHHCNIGLGSFKDDQRLLKLALDYLSNHSQADNDTFEIV